MDRASRMVETVRPSRTLGLPVRSRAALQALLAVLLSAVLVACGGSDAPSTAVPGSPDATGERRAPTSTRVLAISVDGLTPQALDELGKVRTPHLHRLLDEGASTLNARASRELTLTLPNHTTMLTGRRIDRTKGGHGVTWNVDRPRTTVQRAARHAVESVYSKVARAGRSAALFTGKSKFSLFRRSWPAGVDRYRLDERPGKLVGAARKDLLNAKRAFTFLHLAAPDVAGHDDGFMSAGYLEAVQRTDALIGKLLATIDEHDLVADGLTVILTSDHGGLEGTRNHHQNEMMANYKVPFLVWGAGVTAGDLYDLNPHRADPGTKRPGYGAAAQPVRNGDLANVATRLLGLGKVPGSEFGVGDRLRVSAPAAAPAP